MAANKLQWRRIAKGDKLPCQSFLRKKNGEILKLSTIGGVTVGQDAYYLPVDEVIEEIRNYPIEESEDERIRKELLDMCKTLGKSEWAAWLEKQCKQKHQYNSRPRYVGEEELLGMNKQGECPFFKQELIDMGFAFTQDGDLAYPIHKIEKKEFAAWKPSKGQIKALWKLMRYAAPNISVYTKIQEGIESLYQDLKKLKA